MHLAPLIRDLSIILSVAAIVTLIFERIKQPVVLGYLVAGMIVGPFTLITPPVPLIRDLPNVQVWAEIGVIFLMFSLGLEFSFRKLVRVGGSATITAVLEVLIMILLGYQLGQMFGWSFHDSIFLGAMLSISSTTIIIKTFDELGLRTKRFADLVFGVLIVEDLVAILLLVSLSSIAVNQSISLWVLTASTAKLILVVGSWFLLGYFLVPRFIRIVGDTGNEEMLTVVSVGLCLALVVLSAYFHYSVALGAFIMGSILAETKEAHRIDVLMRPLRDMFAAIFFVSVGMMIDPKMLYIHFWPVLIISLVTVIGKMLSSTLGTLLTGQTIRTSVQVGFSLSQIGEFSFIIAGLGSSLGVTSSFLYPIGVAVCVITTFTTPYLLRFADPLADLLLKKLPAPLLQLTNWYSRWIQEQAANTAQSAAFSRLVFRWLLNGVIVTLIFLFVFDTLPFFIDKTGYPHLLALILTYIIAICLSSPFLWGMSTMFNHFSLIENKKGVLQHARGLISFASRLVTILWLDLLSLRFFNARIALFLTFVSVIGFFVFFYHRLEASYRWFEKSFLFTFESKEVKPQEKAMPLFAPWDAHLVRLLVHPNSAVAGKSLQTLKLRSLHGVNIIAIQRDRQTIFAPVATAVLYPADSLLMLGIDDQIETIRPLIEEPSEDIQTEKDLTEYRLKNILVPAFSYLCNKSIRESNLREQYSVIVVGLERANQRQLNPDSWLEIKAEDILWVVGEPALIDELEAKIAEQHLG